MASSRISVDPAALRSSAAQVNNIAANLGNELASLEQIVTATADAWEGAAKDSFENAFNTTYKKHLTDIKNSLEQYAKDMITFADENDDVTAKGARRFEGI